MKRSSATEIPEDAHLRLDESVTKTLLESRRSFRSFLVARVGSEQIADDLLQDAFRKAVESPPQNHNSESVVAWFYRVLRTTLIDHYRASGTEKKRLEGMAEATDNRVPPIDEIKAETCLCMRQLLPTLKPNYAQVLERVDLSEEQPEQVAQALGITRANLDVRLHRAREALRKSLVRVCGACSEHGCLDCSCREAKV